MTSWVIDTDQLAGYEDGIVEEFDLDTFDQEFNSWANINTRRLQIVDESLLGSGAITDTNTGNVRVELSTSDTGDITLTVLGNVIFSPVSSDSTGAITLTLADIVAANVGMISSGALTDTMLANAILMATVADSATIANLIAAASEAFDVWAVTIDPGVDGIPYPAYRYTNFDFNSFATIGGYTYAAGEGGLFELGGDSDNGTNIDSFFKTGKSPVGTERDKRIVDGYLIGTSDLVLPVEVDDETNTYQYRTETDVGQSAGRKRFKMGRGIHAGFYGFAVFNENGGDFDISDIQLRPIVFTRRRR